MADLTLIDTIVIVMLENRSFDHILGHLSYGPYANGTAVDGLREPLQQVAYENLSAGEPYYPFEMPDGMLSSDPPHEREAIATQLAYSPVSGAYRMSGFVEAYFQDTAVNRTRKPDPMGFLPPSDVPITSFLANHFAVCDRWFAPLPASTHPNRLMAVTGDSRVDHTTDRILPADATLLDWATQRGIRWRVYHNGVSFFVLLGRFDQVLGPNFRRFEHFADDVMHEAPETFPQLIWIEPAYADAPHPPSVQPNDNHPPLPVRYGEVFLRDIYQALTNNLARWAKTVLIVTYDEHGGFFDHVPPRPLAYDPPDAAYPRFESTGVRVPALVVSPLVAARSVYSEPLDHTSILQFLAERFSPDESGFSATVNQRRERGMTSVSQVLNVPAPLSASPAPPSVSLPGLVATPPSSPVKTPNQLAFERAALELLNRFPSEAVQKYPDLGEWQRTRRR